MNEPTDIGESETGIQKTDGRSREARQSRAAGRTVSPRQALPRGQYVGRDGEVLTRNVTAEGDQFEIPAGLKEAGWSYQWLSEHILNSPDIVRRHNHQMYQAGWRPVMATGRWNGVFGPASDKGHIRVGDSGLYERPEAMSEDARAEEKAKAQRQISDRDQSLMGGKANVRGLPQGFEMGGKYRGTGGDLKMSIDRGLDIPAPKHDLAGEGE